eukprot:TRINITY_DN9848_c0_g1_i1.p1 TRINITY_DN9848_c0_g1~~TRINITY_DN9848_c0_g1_i1.p1  ORF type:complete len:412 (+),score=61.39 TRINITY_DN9848_c0_g1_i1:844-2079(+)
MASRLWALLAACLGANSQESVPLRRNPVIGILSSPLQLPGRQETSSLSNYSWIWDTYIQALDHFNADVVPLCSFCPMPDFLEMLEDVDAVLLTGGSDDAGIHGGRYPDRMMHHIQAVYDKALRPDPTSASGHLPVWATCQGFQALCVLAAGDPKVVVPTFGTEFEELPLNLTTAARSSGILRDAPQCVLDDLTDQFATVNFHNFGVLASSFDEKRVHGFRLLATDEDKQGQTFAAMVEHEELPIFGTQFHPEMYHWLESSGQPLQQQINHANMYLMGRFVERARAAMLTMRPLARVRSVTWYPSVELPISVLGPAFDARFPGRKLKGYVFESGRPLDSAEWGLRLGAYQNPAPAASLLEASRGTVEGSFRVSCALLLAASVVTAVMLVAIRRWHASTVHSEDLSERLILVA